MRSRGQRSRTSSRAHLLGRRGGERRQSGTSLLSPRHVRRGYRRPIGNDDRILTARTTRTAEGETLWIKASHERNADIERLRSFFPSFFRSHGRDFPWRRTASPYHLLLAEVLLQKTHSRSVGAVWSVLTERWPQPSALAQAPLNAVRNLVRPLGIHKRAQRLRAIAVRVEQVGMGRLSDPTVLLALPGVGTYSMSSVLCQSYGLPYGMTDVNAARIFTRIFGVRTKTLRQALRFAERATAVTLPARRAREFNLGVLDFADAICRVAPKCNVCPLNDTCTFGKRVLRERTA